MKNALNIGVAAYLEELNNLRPLLNSLILILQNTQIPLEIRWEAYSKLIKNDAITTIETYGDGNLTGIPNLDGREICLFDDLYIDRYQTIDYPRLAERLSDKISPENLAIWKERILENPLYAGFTYDW